MTDPIKILPKLRFPEFKNDGEWKVVKLGKIAKRITLKNKDNYSLPVLTNSASGGIVKQEDYFDREIVSKDNLINYYIVSNDDFVYNPRISTIAPVGPISRNKIGEGVMSPLYTVFRFVEGDVDFFEHYFKTNNWHQYLKDKANFGARFDRMNITTEDFISLPIPFPSFPEQQKIAAFLTSLDEQISAHTKKLEALKSHKKGLMQQLFPANGEKTPKLRFPEFKNDGEWEDVRLGELGDTFPGLSGKDKNDFGHGKAEYITYMNVFSNPIAKKELNQNIEIDTKQHSVQYGDFFFTTSSETPQEVGMSSVWLDNKDNVYLNSFCFGYRLNKLHNFNLIFLSYFFRSYYFRKKMVVLAQGISRYNISKIKVMELPLAFPSLPEQQKIASFLTSIDEMIQAQDDKIRKLKIYKNGLMQQMFAK